MFFFSLKFIYICKVFMEILATLRSPRLPPSFIFFKKIGKKIEAGLD